MSTQTARTDQADRTAQTARTDEPDRTAPTARAGVPAGTTPTRAPSSPGEVAVREPTAMDQLELRDLAHRVGEPVPAQPVVVAAVDGLVVAGRSVPTGVVVFDPAHAPAPVRDALRRFARRS